MKKADIRTQELTSFADVGSADGMACARRSLPVVGLGTPIPLVAGNGASSGLLPITAASGKDCYIATTGRILVRFGTVAVTATAFHLVVDPGLPPQPVHVPKDVTVLSAWGDGGAYAFCLVPCS